MNQKPFWKLFSFFLFCGYCLSFASEVTLSKALQMRFPPALFEKCIFSFSADPYIHPKLIEVLSSSTVWSYSIPPFERVCALSLNPDQFLSEFTHHKGIPFYSYFSDYSGGTTVWFNRSRGDNFSYDFIGRTDNGIYVLLICDDREKKFLYLVFEKDYYFESDTHKFKERILIKKVGDHDLCDRRMKGVKVDGNTISVPNEAWVADGTIDSSQTEKYPPYTIDLSTYKNPTLSPPNISDVTSWLSLQCAIDNNLYSDVEPLIQLGAKINSVDSKGRTPLIAASSQFKNGEAVALFLLEKGADPHFLDQQNRSALHHAVERGYNTLSACLIEKKVDIHQVDKEDRTPLIIASDVYENEAGALFLLEKGANPNPIDQKNRTALHYAIKRSFTTLANRLIEKGVNIHQLDQMKRTALHYAIKKELTPLAISLIEKGIDINQEDMEGLTPLAIALATKNVYLSTLLFDRGAFLSKDHLGYAAHCGIPKIVKHLIDQDAKISHLYKFHLYDFEEYWKSSEEQNPLFIATKNGHLDVIRLLLDEGETSNQALNHALDQAVAQGWEEGVSILLKHGAQRSPNASQYSPDNSSLKNEN